VGCGICAISQRGTNKGIFSRPERKFVQKRESELNTLEESFEAQDTNNKILFLRVSSGWQQPNVALGSKKKGRNRMGVP